MSTMVVGEITAYEGGTDPLARALADDRRRALLAFLLEREDAVSTRELADELADVIDRPRSSLAVELAHTHLPQLEDAGLVTVTGRRVETADTRPLETLDIGAADLRSLDDETWDAVTAVAGHPRREAALTVLSERASPLGLEELAREVSDRLEDEEATAVDEERLRLHHVDVPRLAAADLVEYDASERTVAAGPRPPDCMDAILGHRWRRER